MGRVLVTLFILEICLLGVRCGWDHVIMGSLHELQAKFSLTALVNRLVNRNNRCLSSRTPTECSAITCTDVYITKASCRGGGRVPEHRLQRRVINFRSARLPDGAFRQSPVCLQTWSQSWSCDLVCSLSARTHDREHWTPETLEVYELIAGDLQQMGVVRLAIRPVSDKINQSRFDLQWMGLMSLWYLWKF